MTVILAITTTEVLAAAAALVPLVALVVAISQFRLAIRGQVRSAQPVVVVNEVGTWTIEEGGVQFRVFLKNHGVSTAFNVRFGVELGGRRYPHTYGDDEERRGARQVVPPNERVPAGEAQELLVRLTPEEVWTSATARIERRIFWATYENPYGETWETLNPASPHGDLTIRRARRSAMLRRPRYLLLRLERTHRWPGRDLIVSFARRGRDTP